MVNKRYNELMNILMESVYSTYDRRDEVVNRKEKEARRQKYAGKVSKYTRGEYPETYDEDDIRIRDLGKHSTYTGKVTFKSGYSKKSAPGSYNPKQVGSMRGVKKSSDYKSSPSSLMQNLAKSRQARAASKFKNESSIDEAKYESGQSPDVKRDIRNFRSGKGTLTRGEAHRIKRGHKKKPQGSPETRIPASEQTPLQKSIGGNITKETLKYNLMKSRQARAASKFKNESRQDEAKYESGQFPQVKSMVRDYRTGSLEGMRNRGRTHILKRGHKKKPQGFPETRPPASVGKETLEYNLMKSRQARKASKFKNESYQNISEGEKRKKRVLRAWLKTDPGSNEALQAKKDFDTAKAKVDRRNEKLVYRLKGQRENSALARRKAQERRNREKEND